MLYLKRFNTISDKENYYFDDDIYNEPCTSLIGDSDVAYNREHAWLECRYAPQEQTCTVIGSLWAVDEMFVNGESVDASSTLSGLTGEDTVRFKLRYGTTYWYGLFSGCSELTQIEVVNAGDFLPTSTGYMFAECRSLYSIKGLNTSKVVNMERMFQECDSLVDVPIMDYSSCTSVAAMFGGCDSLVDCPLIDSRNITNFGPLFRECSNLMSFAFTDISNVTSYGGSYYPSMLWGVSTEPTMTLTKSDGVCTLKGNYAAKCDFERLGQILVPNHLVEAYKNDESWSPWSDKITGF